MSHRNANSTRDGARSPLVPLVQRLESAESLDPVADRLTPLVAPMVSSTRLRSILRGDWLGHSAHPVLTDIPLGAWTCTSVLDLVGGRDARPAAEGLLALGLATATPTAVTGAADWLSTSGANRRVGMTHAAINLAAFGLYGASLVSRRRGRHAAGVGLALLGGLTAAVGGYLGGHLAIARSVGSGDPAFDRPPAEAP